jgi:hypothetical protein
LPSQSIGQSCSSDDGQGDPVGKKIKRENQGQKKKLLVNLSVENLKKRKIKK